MEGECKDRWLAAYRVSDFSLTATEMNVFQYVYVIIIIQCKGP